MNYATIKWFDVSNGPGVRVSLYVSGCRNHCKNCFNPETWDFSLKPQHIKGFTLLGGDPFEPENQTVLAPFLENMRAQYPDKSLWCFTGYDYEKDLLSGRLGDKQTVLRMLSCLDVLVDGKFVEELKDLSLRFRGSSNQRIILVQPSLKQKKIVLWDETKEL